MALKTNLPRTIWIRIGLAVLLTSIPAMSHGGSPVTEGWSAYENGLKARVSLEQRAKFNGSRKLAPYLELKNLSQLANPVRVRCDEQHVTFDLVDAEGKVLDPTPMPLDGISPEIETIVLPFDSAIRMYMGASIWGVPKDAAAMISTENAAWVLKPEQKGKVFLRVTIHGDKTGERKDHIWHGKIQAWVKIDWKEDK